MAELFAARPNRLLLIARGDDHALVVVKREILPKGVLCSDGDGWDLRSDLCLDTAARAQDLLAGGLGTDRDGGSGRAGLVGIHAFLGLSSARESVEVVHIAVSVPAATMAILTISVMIAFAVWGRGLARLLCGLIGLTTGLLIAVPMGLFAGHDLAAIEATRLFTLPIADYPCIYQRLI